MDGAEEREDRCGDPARDHSMLWRPPLFRATIGLSCAKTHKLFGNKFFESTSGSNVAQWQGCGRYSETPQRFEPYCSPISREHLLSLAGQQQGCLLDLSEKGFKITGIFVFVPCGRNGLDEWAAHGNACLALRDEQHVVPFASVSGGPRTRRARRRQHPKPAEHWFSLRKN